MPAQEDHLDAVDRSVTPHELQTRVVDYLEAIGRPDLRNVSYDEAALEVGSAPDPVLRAASDRWDELVDRLGSRAG